jgi:tripartite-type tricarboxylate transporter receptor subunit TctC
MNIFKKIGLITTLYSTMALATTTPTTTIVVGFPPGGGNYTVANIISTAAEKAGYPTILDIKPGAGGIVGMNHCVSKVSDKNLLCIASQTQYVHGAILSPDIVKFDPEKLSYVKMVGYSPSVLVTRPSNQKSFSELIDDMKKNKPVSFGSPALGYSILTYWLFSNTPTSNGIVVDYKGAAPMIVDIIGGSVEYGFVPYTVVKSQVDSGALRIVAAWPDKNAPVLSKYPNIQQYVKEMEPDKSLWGFVLGEGADTEQVKRYNVILTTLMQDSDVQNRFESVGIFMSDPKLGPVDFELAAKHERAKLIKQYTPTVKEIYRNK